MSGWAEERRILEAWFYAQWTGLALPWNLATVPVEWEGQVFDPPAGGGPYMSMFVLNASDGTQVSLGSPALNRYVGMIQFTISCPIGLTGGPNETAREIGDLLDALWKGRRFQTSAGRIRCRVPGLHTLGNVDGRWVAVMTVPYLRDEIAPIPPAVLLPNVAVAGMGVACGLGTLSTSSQDATASLAGTSAACGLGTFSTVVQQFTGGTVTLYALTPAPDNETTTFTASVAISPNAFVVKNGQVMNHAAGDYTYSGFTITFPVAPGATDDLELWQ